jgi:hypothetical protein
MPKYIVDINGTFTAAISIEIDGEGLEDEIYGIAEKQLQDMFSKNDYSLIDNIELECIDHEEVEED